MSLAAQHMEQHKENHFDGEAAGGLLVRPLGEECAAAMPRRD